MIDRFSTVQLSCMPIRNVVQIEMHLINAAPPDCTERTKYVGGVGVWDRHLGGSSGRSWWPAWAIPFINLANKSTMHVAVTNVRGASFRWSRTAQEFVRDRRIPACHEQMIFKEAGKRQCDSWRLVRTMGAQHTDTTGAVVAMAQQAVPATPQRAGRPRPNRRCRAPRQTTTFHCLMIA